LKHQFKGFCYNLNQLWNYATYSFSTTFAASMSYFEVSFIDIDNSDFPEKGFDNREFSREVRIIQSIIVLPKN